MANKKAIASINTKIRIRKKQIKELENNLKELNTILDAEQVAHDQIVKTVHLKNQLSNRLVKLHDEIEIETQKKNKLQASTISSDDLKMEDLQKKIKHRELQIQKLNEKLISREEVEQKWDATMTILADLGRKLAREYKDKEEPAILFYKAALKKLEDV